MFLVILAAILLPRPSLASRGIYCTSYQYIDRGEMICTVKCVICENLDTGEIIYEECYDSSCWFPRV